MPMANTHLLEVGNFIHPNYDGVWIQLDGVMSIKHFTTTHFTWVDIGENDKVVTSVGGGRVFFIR